MRVSLPRNKRGCASRSLAVSASQPSPACGGRASGRPACRPGFNLIEVVAATVILGLLAAGLVLASARMKRQEALMQRKQRAVELADRLIAAKTTTPGQDGAMAWTVTPLFEPALQNTGLTMYSLRVVEQSGSAVPGAELTVIEFVAQEMESKMTDGGRQTVGGQP